MPPIRNRRERQPWETVSASVLKEIQSLIATVHWEEVNQMSDLDIAGQQLKMFELFHGISQGRRDPSILSGIERFCAGTGKFRDCFDREEIDNFDDANESREAPFAAG